MISYALDRLEERSTWIGLGGLFSSIIYWFTDLYFDDFITILVGTIGLIAIIIPDKK